MTKDNNTPIDTTDVTTTSLNVAATDATVTTTGNITASTAAATTSTILPAGNAADETTRRSLFGAGLYQTDTSDGGETLALLLFFRGWSSAAPGSKSSFATSSTLLLGFSQTSSMTPTRSSCVNSCENEGNGLPNLLNFPHHYVIEAW
ncbi:hypothetical protein F2Q68_00033990 [Brassica cretica]|uniref:Uncharacterized protein n=1 Tax=Brassica cretica TaxID=69181 RepID=A0A8S9H7F1_BRACR|nr:hypothetical protein F2Q68_00033990 [Brassica cretica]